MVDQSVNSSVHFLKRAWLNARFGLLGLVCVLCCFRTSALLAGIHESTRKPDLGLGMHLFCGSDGIRTARGGSAACIDGIRAAITDRGTSVAD